MQLACFVSAHGYGHATRTRAVLDALARLDRDLGVQLFTAAPPWLFSDLDAALACHAVDVDPGPTQRSAFDIDIDATAAALGRSLPFDERQVDALAARVRSAGCAAVLCDISPLGLLVAQRAGVPGVLVENFTWDWIYAGLGDDRLAPFVEYLGACFAACRWRVQTEPVCRPGGDLVVPPVSRRPRHGRAATRAILDVDDAAPLVLISLGGTPHRLGLADRLANEWPDVTFLLAGDAAASPRPNVIVPETAAALDHPSLIAAADLVIGKAGYSTVAEAYTAGVPFACFSRPGFPESPPLEAFVRANMPSVILPGDTFDDGAWLDRLDALLELAPVERVGMPDGAEAVARFVRDRAGGEVERFRRIT